MLAMEHVSKSFGSSVIIEDACVEFSAGVTGLIAPNGAGKSTFIKMLATLLFPSEGEIRLDGEEIHALGEEYRAQLGYLPQQFGYYPNYTPRKFLRYVGALQRMDARAAATRANDLIDLVGLSDVADRRMRDFSGGMVQRIGIATALLNDPRILILDEPTAGLDPRERVRFRNIIHELACDRTVILSTHIVSDVETIAGQIVLIENARVHAYPSAAALCEELRGRVFEVPASESLSPCWQVLSEAERDGATVLRVAAPIPLHGTERVVPQRAVTVEPRLEDAFLVRYAEGK